MNENKNHYFYITIGYIGVLFIFVASLRYISIIDDVMGRSLINFGLIFILSSLRFIQTKFLSVKERRMVDWSFFSVVAIIIVIGFILL